MTIEELYRVKYTMMFQVVQDILVENGLINHKEFKEKLLAKVDSHESFDEKIKKALKENIE